MSSRLRQYGFALLAGLWLLAYQVRGIYLTFGQGGANPKADMMQRQLAEELLSRPDAAAVVVGYLVLGLVTHIVLGVLAIVVYRQATTVAFKHLRERFAPASGFLFVWLLGALFAHRNLFPLSSAFSSAEILMVQRLSPILIAATAIIIISATLAAGYAVWRDHRKTFASLAFVCLLVSLGMPALSNAGGDRALSVREPDVIVLGVDSLRPDVLPAYGFGHAGLTPNIDKVLANSVVLSDARTPLARTFVSYMSLLTGSNPVKHGARFNLYPRSQFEQSTTLAWTLKAQGYETMFAMDESRFANFDQSFGFDRVVVPEVGALDFAIGGSYDLLATNLLTLVVPPNRWMSYIEGNRAAYRSYRPVDHPERVVRELTQVPAGKPLFLISHLCLPHWPYQPASLFDKDALEWVDEAPDYRDIPRQYLRAIRGADAQVGTIMEELRRQGRLNNAIVVLMSDHGEDFAMSRDMLTQLDADGRSFERGFYGHGSFALSEPQNHIVMGIQRYRDGKPEWTPRHLEGDASIIDLAPTVADLLDVGMGFPHEGISWRPALDARSDLSAERIRFFENGIRSTGVERAQIDEKAVAQEMSYLYEITEDLRFEIKESLLPGKLGEKQRGAALGDIGVMTDPVVEHGSMAGDCWRVVDYRHKTFRCVGYPAQEPEVVHLQREVCRYFQSDQGFDERWCRAQDGGREKVAMGKGKV